MMPEQRWRDRLANFMAEKTAAAVRASLPPYVTDESQPGERLISVGNEWTTRLFDGPFYLTQPHGARPACSLVFVQSADGNTGARNPSSLGGGDTDKHLVYEGLSRVAADAVLAGADTVRGGQLIFSVFHPELVALRASLGLPRHPLQIVATRRGIDLGAALIFNVPEVPVMLLTVDEAAERMQDDLRERPWVTTVTMRDPEDLPGSLVRLRTMGIGTISCIGGRTLARQLLDAGLVDDVYVTTAARAGGEPGTLLHTRPWRGALITRKHGTGPEAGVIFEHVQPVKTRQNEA